MDDRPAHWPRLPALALAIAFSAALIVAAPMAAADPGPRPTTFQARVPRCDVITASPPRLVAWGASGAAILIGVALWGLLRRRGGVSRRLSLAVGLCAGLGGAAALAPI